MGMAAEHAWSGEKEAERHWHLMEKLQKLGFKGVLTHESKGRMTCLQACDDAHSTDPNMDPKRRTEGERLCDWAHQYGYVPSFFFAERCEERSHCLLTTISI